MPTPTAADRLKAQRIRGKIRAKSIVSAEDAAWLSEYENATARGRGESGNTRMAIGASAASSRKVSYTEEETAAASVGTGSAAEMAAAAAMTREEGRRLDNIVDRGINALVRAVECYEKVCTALLKERHEDALTHRELLTSLRSHFLDRTQAEADLLRQRAEFEASEKEDESEGLEGAAVRALLEKLAPAAPQAPAHNGRRGKPAQ